LITARTLSGHITGNGGIAKSLCDFGFWRTFVLFLMLLHVAEVLSVLFGHTSCLLEGLISGMIVGSSAFPYEPRHHFTCMVS